MKSSRKEQGRLVAAGGGWQRSVALTLEALLLPYLGTYSRYLGT